MPARDYRLLVEFVDGTKGWVDLGRFFASPMVAVRVFERLRDRGEFSRVSVTYGVVTWPNGADLAPDAMPARLLTAGSPSVWVVEEPLLG